MKRQMATRREKDGMVEVKSVKKRKSESCTTAAVKINVKVDSRTRMVKANLVGKQR
mgnify:CR=1 FL=1